MKQISDHAANLGNGSFLSFSRTLASSLEPRPRAIETIAVTITSNYCGDTCSEVVSFVWDTFHYEGKSAPVLHAHGNALRALAMHPLLLHPFLRSVYGEIEPEEVAIELERLGVAGAPLQLASPDTLSRADCCPYRDIPPLPRPPEFVPEVVPIDDAMLLQACGALQYIQTEESVDVNLYTHHDPENCCAARFAIEWVQDDTLNALVPRMNADGNGLKMLAFYPLLTRPLLGIEGGTLDPGQFPAGLHQLGIPGRDLRKKRSVDCTLRLVPRRL